MQRWVGTGTCGVAVAVRRWRGRRCGVQRFYLAATAWLQAFLLLLLLLHSTRCVGTLAPAGPGRGCRTVDRAQAAHRRPRPAARDAVCRAGTAGTEQPKLAARVGCGVLHLRSATGVQHGRWGCPAGGGAGGRQGGWGQLAGCVLHSHHNHEWIRGTGTWGTKPHLLAAACLPSPFLPASRSGGWSSGSERLPGWAPLL